VDGRDDLPSVDSLQVDRRRAEVRVPELALDDVERNPLPRELERVRGAELMRRERADTRRYASEPAGAGW